MSSYNERLEWEYQDYLKQRYEEPKGWYAYGKKFSS